MKITLQTEDNEDVEIDVEPSDTIGDIKLKLSEKKGLIPQLLWAVVGKSFSNRKWVVDDTIVSSLDNYPKTNIIMFETDYCYRLSKIKFENKTGLRTMMLGVNPFTFIEEIKFNIQNETGIPLEKIRLFSEEHELLNWRTLFEWGISRFSFINAVIDEEEV